MDYISKHKRKQIKKHSRNLGYWYRQYIFKNQIPKSAWNLSEIGHVFLSDFQGNDQWNSVLFDLLNLETEAGLEIKSCLGITFEVKSKYFIALTIIRQAHNVQNTC